MKTTLKKSIKAICLLAAIGLTTNSLKAQNIFANSPGPLGGIISDINPGKTLTGQCGTYNLYNMTGTYGDRFAIYGYPVGGNAATRFNIWDDGHFSFHSHDGINQTFTILDNGYVGIMSQNPQAPLDVWLGDVHGVVASFRRGAASVQFLTGSCNACFNPMMQANDNGIIFTDQGGNNANSGYVIAPWGNVAAGMRIAANGNVGIGTVQTGTCKLAVEGKIGCREIDVLAAPALFPDYVFQKNYSFLSLNDLEKFVSLNKHLPNIPSASEVAANDNKGGLY
jgi:hypothetical protein